VHAAVGRGVHCNHRKMRAKGTFAALAAFIATAGGQDAQCATAGIDALS